MVSLTLLITFVIFAAFLSFTLVNHLFLFIFLYIEYGLIRLKSPELYAAVSIRQYIKSFWLEYIYMMGKFYLYPYKFFDLTENPSKNTTAVLLIHGYARNQSDWLWFINRLSEIPLPIYTVNLTPPFASIQQIAENSLIEKIKEIKQQTGCQELIIIGHSMGGLVASYYSEYLDQSKLVTKVITIASPFHGTKISIAAAGANAKQMLPWAIFTDELREKIKTSDKKYYQVASQFDNLIFPWQSVLLEFMPQEHQLIMPLQSHLGLLHSEVVVKQVINWIKGIDNAKK